MNGPAPLGDLFNALCESETLVSLGTSRKKKLKDNRIPGSHTR